MGRWASEGNVNFVEFRLHSLEELILETAMWMWSLMDALFEKRQKGTLKRLKTVTLVL
jgi:hypothetical protein